jgi:Lipid A 3-O-deacylase (PagL)
MNNRRFFVPLILGGAFVCHAARAAEICSGCEIQTGLGGTYHFWDSTEGLVLPFTLSWHENRYELGVFRMASRQMINDNQWLADPYWGVSASRRWRLLERGPVRAFFGFGLSYRSETDVLSATRWNFASQLGVRVRLPRRGTAVELAMRHWSNAGVKEPNHGQDFVTLTFLLDPRSFRLDGFDQVRPLRIHPEREAYAQY